MPSCIPYIAWATNSYLNTVSWLGQFQYVPLMLTAFKLPLERAGILTSLAISIFTFGGAAAEIAGLLIGPKCKYITTSVPVGHLILSLLFYFNAKLMSGARGEIIFKIIICISGVFSQLGQQSLIVWRLDTMANASAFGSFSSGLITQCYCRYRMNRIDINDPELARTLLSELLLINLSFSIVHLTTMILDLYVYITENPPYKPFGTLEFLKLSLNHLDYAAWGMIYYYILNAPSDFFYPSIVVMDVDIYDAENKAERQSFIWISNIISSLVIALIFMSWEILNPLFLQNDRKQPMYKDYMSVINIGPHSCWPFSAILISITRSVLSICVTMTYHYPNNYFFSLFKSYKFIYFLALIFGLSKSYSFIIFIALYPNSTLYNFIRYEIKKDSNIICDLRRFYSRMCQALKRLCCIKSEKDLFKTEIEKLNVKPVSVSLLMLIDLYSTDMLTRYYSIILNNYNMNPSNNVTITYYKTTFSYLMYMLSKQITTTTALLKTNYNSNSINKSYYSSLMDKLDRLESKDKTYLDNAKENLKKSRELLCSSINKFSTSFSDNSNNVIHITLTGSNKSSKPDLIKAYRDIQDSKKLLIDSICDINNAKENRNDSNDSSSSSNCKCCTLDGIINLLCCSTCNNVKCFGKEECCKGCSSSCCQSSESTTECCDIYKKCCKKVSCSSIETGYNCCTNSSDNKCCNEQCSNKCESRKCCYKSNGSCNNGTTCNCTCCTDTCAETSICNCCNDGKFCNSDNGKTCCIFCSDSTGSGTCSCQSENKSCLVCCMSNLIKKFKELESTTSVLVQLGNAQYLFVSIFLFGLQSRFLKIHCELKEARMKGTHPIDKLNPLFSFIWWIWNLLILYFINIIFSICLWIIWPLKKLFQCFSNRNNKHRKIVKNVSQQPNMH